MESAVSGSGDAAVIRIAENEDALIPGLDSPEQLECRGVRGTVIDNAKLPIGIGLRD